ncbi:MAG: RdgB/HAM1 family non-canonical purine NTP pyrophosphatase [Clostridiales bacterium]|nr:RdgB/HAM1 family non-canonical purine NTP pyrophosphatase [Clostridiales bacterium]
MNLDMAVIATGNPHKLREIGEILKDFNIEIKSMKDMGLENLNIIEDGDTFEENALKKARTIMKASGCISIADDSGLEVEALDNQPGVNSARFAGENASDEENNEKLLKILTHKNIKNPRARFVCVIAVVMPNGESFTTRGELYGIIGSECRGNNGFGYDPLFIPDGYNGLTLGEISEIEKNKISHRAKALKKMEILFRERLKNVRIEDNSNK